MLKNNQIKIFHYLFYVKGLESAISSRRNSFNNELTSNHELDRSNVENQVTNLGCGNTIDSAITSDGRGNQADSTMSSTGCDIRIDSATSSTDYDHSTNSELSSTGCWFVTMGQQQNPSHPPHPVPEQN